MSVEVWRRDIVQIIQLAIRISLRNSQRQNHFHSQTKNRRFKVSSWPQKKFRTEICLHDFWVSNCINILVRWIFSVSKYWSIVDWYESQWWLNATKNGGSKWKSSSGRNRTKVYIYPSYGHFDDIESPKTTIPTTTANTTISNEETLIILPGIKSRILFNFS